MSDRISCGYIIAPSQVRLSHTYSARGHLRPRLEPLLIGVKPGLRQISRCEQPGQSYESSGNDTLCTPFLPQRQFSWLPLSYTQPLLLTAFFVTWLSGQPCLR